MIPVLLHVNFPLLGTLFWNFVVFVFCFYELKPGSFTADYFIFGNKTKNHVPDVVCTMYVLHCPGEESKTRFSTLLVFFSLICKNLQNFIVGLVYCLTFRQPKDVDGPLNKYTCKKSSRLSICISMLSSFVGCQILPMHGLLLGFRIILKNLNLGGSLDNFQCVCTNSHPKFFLLKRGVLVPPLHTLLVLKCSYKVCLAVYLSKFDVLPVARMLKQ